MMPHAHGYVAQADPGEDSEDDGIPRGIWKWNGAEWRWTPAAKQIPEDILECRIMLRFPASTGYQCTKAERKLWHQNIWETLIPQHTEVSYRTQIVGARRRLCEEQWQQIHWVPAYPKPCGRAWDNSADQVWSAESMVSNREHEPECYCQQLAAIAPEAIDTDAGHIRTSNIDSILESPDALGLTRRHLGGLRKIKACIHKGRKFRPQFQSESETTETTWQSLSRVTTDALDMICSDTEVIPETARARVLHTAKSRAERMLDGHRTPHMGTTRRAHSARQGHKLGLFRQCVEALQACLVITRVDKSEANFSFVCKHLYRSTLLGRLMEDGDFTPVPPERTHAEGAKEGHIPLETVIHGKLASVLNLHQDTGQGPPFPTMIASVKEKKLRDPSKTPEFRASRDVWRFITAASNYPVKLASRLHVQIGARLDVAYYKHCVQRSKSTWGKMPWSTRRKAKVKFYFQAKEVTNILRNAPHKVTWVSNGDHSKMFEKLPHTGPVSIVEACRHKFRIALQEKDSYAIMVNTKSSWTRWTRLETHDMDKYPPEEGWVLMCEDRYISMVHLILESAIVDVGGMLFRQVNGIPMGFDDSPHMSATFFDFLDYRFIDTAVRIRDWTTATKMAGMSRVADDIFCFNCPDFFEVMRTWGTVGEASAWHSITLNDETKYSDFMGKKVGVSADMCDATISYDRWSGSVRYKLYDKLQHMQGFSTEVIRYPSHDSNGPRAVLRSIVVGQVSAYAHRCRATSSLMEACARLFIRLIGNGYKIRQISDAIQRVDLHQAYGPGPKVTTGPEWTAGDHTTKKLLTLAAACHRAIGALPDSQRRELFRGVANDTLTSLIAHLK